MRINDEGPRGPRRIMKDPTDYEFQKKFCDQLPYAQIIMSLLNLDFSGRGQFFRKTKNGEPTFQNGDNVLMCFFSWGTDTLLRSTSEFIHVTKLPPLTSSQELSSSQCKLDHEDYQ